MPRHKHADLMIAYANDTSLVIEVSDGGEWGEASQPSWSIYLKYRIKPTPKKSHVFLYDDGGGKWYSYSAINAAIVEVERNTMLSAGCNVTEIKEVVFE